MFLIAIAATVLAAAAAALAIDSARAAGAELARLTLGQDIQ